MSAAQSAVAARFGALRSKLPWAQITAAFLGTRLVMLTLVYATRTLIPERAGNRHKDYSAFPDSPLWDSFARWDSGWYDRIARNGYYQQGGQSDVAFFPAYPYAARFTGKLLGISHWAGGLVVSNVCLLLGLFYLYALARKLLGDDGARRTMWMALAFPTAIFFSCFYTESLYLFAVAAAFYYYEDDRYLPAALFGAPAACTRSTGLLLAPALFLGAIHRRHWRPRLQTPRILWFVLIPLGLVGFMWMLRAQVGDPLAFLKAQAMWGRTSGTIPLKTLFDEAHHLDDLELHKIWDLGACVFLFAAFAYSLTQFDSAMTIFLGLSILMPLSSGKVHSMERYALMVPSFLVLGGVTKNASVERFVLLAMSLFLALHTVLFADWYWAG